MSRGKAVALSLIVLVLAVVGYIVITTPSKTEKKTSYPDFTQHGQSMRDLLDGKQFDTIKSMLHAGLMSQGDKDLALRVLSGKGQYELVEDLADNGGVVDSPGRYGLTPLMEAVTAGDVRMVRLLVKHGAKVLKDSCTDESYLIRAAVIGNVEMVHLLIDGGACIDCQCVTDSGDGGTPLYHAAMWGKTGAVEALLDSGADPDVDTEWGFTPLMIASQNGNHGCVKVLLRHGARVSSRNWQPDPVALARANGHEEVAHILEGAEAR